MARHVHWDEYGLGVPILCASAWDALKAVQEQTIDLMLVDVYMPGKDGLALLGECRRVQADIYAVMISSIAEFDDTRRAMQNGAREYLLKPVKPADVYQVLQGFLRWKAAKVFSAVGVDQNAAAVMRPLEEHVMDGITISELADDVHMNASYLCTLFKKTYGVTIADHLNQLQRACQLLATSDLSMGEIAHQTGNRNASTFAQWFRKSVGMTPGEYRRLIRNGSLQHHISKEEQT